METQNHWLSLVAPDVAHPACPDGRRANFAISSEEVNVRVKEEGQSGRELVDVESAGLTEFHVAEAVRQREGELCAAVARLRGMGSRIPTAACNAARLSGVFHEVTNEAQVRFRREDPPFCAMYSLKMSVCSVPSS